MNKKQQKKAAKRSRLAQREPIEELGQTNGHVTETAIPPQGLVFEGKIALEPQSIESLPKVSRELLQTLTDDVAALRKTEEDTTEAIRRDRNIRGKHIFEAVKAGFEQGRAMRSKELA